MKERAIRTMIEGKNANEKATIKAREIAKLNLVGNYANDKYRVEIISIKQIAGGVEVLAKGWQNGKPLGFGADGSVEIERFRFFNPPILVADELGNINIDRLDNGIVNIRKYREDPKQALQEILTHVIKATGKDGGNIQGGKIGRTTSTIFATNDGTVGVSAAATWAAAQGAASGSASTGSIAIAAYWRTVDSKYYINRGFTDYDTSVIGTDDITTAKIYMKPSSVTPRSGLCGVNIYSSTSATPLDNNSYNDVGTTAFSTAIGFGSLSVGTYSEWVLNSTGRATINKTGTTKFAVRESTHDVANSSPAQDLNPNMAFYNSTASGTSDDPNIVIEHEAAGGLMGIERKIYRGVGRGILRP